MIALWGTGICFSVAAGAFLASLVGLFLLREHEFHPKRQAGRGAVLSQLWDGVRYSFSSPSLGFNFVLMAFIGTFAYNWGLVLPLLARYGLDAGPEGFGALNIAMGLGSVLGGVLLSALSGFGVATASQPWQLYVFAGIVPGLAFAGASSVPATVLLAGWFVSRLGLATGVMSSAIPAGQSVFVPLATALLPSLGWRATYIVLGLGVAAVELQRLLVHGAVPRGNAGSVTSRPGPASAACSVRLRRRPPCRDCRAARPAPLGDVFHWQRRKARACWSR